MFKSVSRVSVLKCKTNDGLTFTPRTGRIHIFRWYTGKLEEKRKKLEDESSEMNFTDFLEQRRAQAARSFFIEFKQHENVKKLFKMCNVYGNVKEAYRCSQLGSHYLVIEMQEEESVNKVLQNMYGPHVYGCRNQFIVLDSLNVNFNWKSDVDDEFMKHVKTCEQNSLMKVVNGELSKKVNTLSDTITNCYNSMKINEFEMRKKFLTCYQIEKFCRGFLENHKAYPFGSSVSGFGLNGGDLDIALLPGTADETKLDINFLSDTDKLISRKQLGIIYEVMKNFSNWASELIYVKNARVPIVKLKNTITNVECDVSLNNPHGVAMSQMYYMLASVDWRVRALGVFIKLWASKLKLTSKSPTTKPTNFSLSVLVIFFLQQIKMLPPLNIFPCKDSQYLVEPEPKTLSLLNDMRRKCNNDKSLEVLLKEFLEFYSTFDFMKWGISIRDGKPVLNKDKYPLYLENPIYTDVNMSYNVRPNGVEDFQTALFHAVLVLKGESNQEQIRAFFNLNINGRKSVNFFKCIDDDVQLC